MNLSIKNNKLWILIVGITFGIVCPGHLKAQESRNSHHVVLISIDGFRPEFYLEGKWLAPNLQEMAKSGARALGVTGNVHPLFYT